MYQQAILSLQRELDRSKQQIVALDQQYNDLLVNYHATNQRQHELERQADLYVLLREQHNTLQERHRQLRLRTERNEDMASILSKGVQELSAREQQLSQRTFDETSLRSRIETLQNELNRHQAARKALSEELTRAQNRNEQLFADLSEASLQLEQVVSQVRGTALEQLLHSSHEEAPLVQIIPGRPITFGGDYLLTMHVNPGNQADSVATRLVIQGPHNEQIPDVEVIFYGSDGKPLRKMRLGFPDSDSTRGFASAHTELSMSEFPTSARMIVSQAVPDEFFTQRNVWINLLGTSENPFPSPSTHLAPHLRPQKYSK